MRRIHALLLTGLLASGLFLSGCQPQNAKDNGATVATVNGDVITRGEFDDTLTRNLKMMHMDPGILANEKGNPMLPVFKKLTLDSLIYNSLIEAEAKKRHIDIEPPDVDGMYERHVQNAGSEKAMEERLHKVGITKKEFMSQLQDQLLKQRVIEAVAGDKIKVSDAEARKFYEAHPEQSNRPEQVHARHILIAANPEEIKATLKKSRPGATDAELDKQIAPILTQKRVKAEGLYQQVILKPDEFESFARRLSDDKGSAKNGGDLGFAAFDDYVPPFAKAAFGTKPGQIYPGLVHTSFGYHIIEVLDRKPAEQKGFDAMKPDIVSFLELQQKQEYLAQWLKTHRDKAKIVIAKAYQFEMKKPPATAVAPKSS